MSKKYNIELFYTDGRTEIIELQTNNIEWSIDQYQRNRDPFDYKIIGIEDEQN